MESIAILLVVIPGHGILGLGFLLAREIIAVVLTFCISRFGFGYIVYRALGVAFQDVIYEASAGLWASRANSTKDTGLREDFQQLRCILY